MSTTLKEKWVTALRSGNFKQGQGALCRVRDGQPSYCCLGVAAEIMNIPVQEKIGDIVVYKDRGGSVLNVEDYRILGINESIAQSLVRMNDRGTTFKEIADWIENVG